MLKSLLIPGFAVLCLVSADGDSDIIYNDIILSDNGNNLTEFDVVSTSNASYTLHDDGGKKVVNIVVNPIIHNVANGFGGGSTQSPIGTSTVSSVTTTSPPDQLLADVIRVFFRKTRFLARFMLNGFTALLRAAIRFVICTFIPLCGIFGVLSDEPDLESTATPEGVVRGLDFLEGIIEGYHSLRNSSLI